VRDRADTRLIARSQVGYGQGILWGEHDALFAGVDGQQRLAAASKSSRYAICLAVDPGHPKGLVRARACAHRVGIGVADQVKKFWARRPRRA
jgi:hypothetical protein